MDLGEFVNFGRTFETSVTWNGYWVVVHLMSSIMLKTNILLSVESSTISENAR